jgi:hypothetical protein
MKTYKKEYRKVEDKVYCDLCGHNCFVDNFGSEYATLEAAWGYGSKYDGTKFDIHLCENCFDETLHFFRQKRKDVLGPFTYPYDNDPFVGYQYPVL